MHLNRRRFASQELVRWSDSQQRINRVRESCEGAGLHLLAGSKDCKVPAEYCRFLAVFFRCWAAAGKSARACYFLFAGHRQRVGPDDAE